MERLAEMAASIGRDPTGVAREARTLAVDARERDDWDLLSRSQAVHGRALRMLGEIELAENALLEAVAAAEKAGDDELAADAHLALAGTMSIAGRWPMAFGHLDEVDRLGSEEMRGIAQLQRAAVCRDAGQVDEALRLLAGTIPWLRREARWLDLARVLANRGSIRAGGGELAAAIADYEESERLYLSVGQDFAALQARHDLACSLANMGDLPRALQTFDEVTARFVELGHDASVPLLSRAEALLQGGLSADALPFSQDAARRLHAEGNSFAAAQALMSVAEAGRLEGDLATALDAARRAQQWFATNRSVGWERAAELEAMRSQFELQGLPPAAVARLEEMADALSDVGDLRNEIYARCMAAVAATAHDDLESAAQQARSATRLARRTRSLQPRLAAHHAAATVRLAEGSVPAARRELRAALDALDSARELRGVGDAGTALLTQARPVTELAAHMSMVERQPMRALEWMERARFAARVSQPALPPTDDAAAADFSHLRAIAADLRHAELAGEPTDQLRRRHAELEQSMRAGWLKLAQPDRRGGRGLGSDPLPHLGELTAMLDGIQIVSVTASGNRLVAVTVDRRRSRSCELGDARHVSAAADRAKSALRGLSSSGHSAAVGDARERAFAAAIESLDRTLLAPLNLRAPHVVLVVPPQLHTVPWAAMPSLAGRSFTLAPSLRWWLDGVSSQQAAPSSALVVAGPRLAEADAEARNVAACHPRSTLLIGNQASIANVNGSLASHDIVHVVAHGRFRHDNPLWSTIELADGPLTVYEIERMGAVPATVVLASCDSGIGGAHGGAQLHGLAGTLLSMGARTIVAAIGALPDTAETRDAMVSLHQDLAAGSRASESLARQRSAAHGRFSATGAALITLGIG